MAELFAVFVLGWVLLGILAVIGFLRFLIRFHDSRCPVCGHSSGTVVLDNSDVWFCHRCRVCWDAVGLDEGKRVYSLGEVFK